MPLLRTALTVAVLGAAIPGAFAAGAMLLRSQIGNADERVAAAQLLRGGAVYAAECASCHGARGEGQPNWQRPSPDGRLPAPPHDASGHTWQHSDAQLRALILQGPAGGGAPPGYASAMPAYAGRLSEAQVADVIAWLKALWPPGVQAWQAAQNPGGPGLTALPGDWRFPATCTPDGAAGG